MTNGDERRKSEQYQEIEKKRDNINIKVQAGLLKLEAKDEWDNLEKKWSQLNKELSPTKDATEEAMKDIGVAAKLLMNELADGYNKIIKTLKQ